MSDRVEEPAFDLAIAGGGATGLAAAIQGASDGMRVVLLERADLGGRVRERARVEIVPGLPVGLSGPEFAERAIALAKRFGADTRAGAEVVGLETGGEARRLRLADGTAVSARGAIIAIGTERPAIPAPGVGALTGRGVHFRIPARLPVTLRGRDFFVSGEPVAVAGAVLRLSRHCRRAEPIAAPLEIVDAVGVERLEVLILRDRRSGRTLVRNAAALFILGMDRPRTGWLAGRLALDAWGYLLTGRAARHCGERAASLETSVRGVFAAGGVRAAGGSGADGPGAEGIVAARQALLYVNARARGETGE